MMNEPGINYPQMWSFVLISVSRIIVFVPGAARLALFLN